MNAALEKVLAQLTGRNNLSDVSIEDIEQIVSEHPYCSAGHLLLTRKLKLGNDPRYAAQLQKTAIYIPNTSWLQYQLHEDPTVSDDEEDIKPLLKRVIEEENEIKIPSVERVKEIMDGTEEKGPVTDETLEPATPIEDVAEISQPIFAELAGKKTIEENVIAVKDEIEAEEDIAETTEEVVEQMEIDEKQKSAIASLLNEQLEAFKKPIAEDAALPIETEPYHTIDYFASQGIKVDLNKGQDKLTTQLRKFTDWLKHMKTAPANAEDLGTDPELEGAIHNIANTSNEIKEVVTETMAEVLVKQGKIEKAVQLYIKLSFLNPDKSAYFAARIQELKGI